MKIVQVITSAEWGGAQRHVYDLSRGLREMNHEVIVLYGIEGKLRRILDDEGFRTEQVPALTRKIRPWQDVWALSTIKKQIERLGPDVVHVHSSKAGALVRLALRRSRIPVVYTIHGLVYLNGRMPEWKKRLYRTIELSLLPLAKTTILVSYTDLQELERWRTSKQTRLVHIPNGIDPFPEPVPFPDQPVIGTVARFTEEKALDILLKAVAEVRKQVPAVRLIMVGDGPLRPELEQLARELAIDDITQFAGYQENIVEWLGKMRVFALTSVKEGMPYTVLEAMSVGRLVVASRVGAIAEVSQSDQMLLVNADQISSVVEALVVSLTRIRCDNPGARVVLSSLHEMVTMVAAVLQRP